MEQNASTLVECNSWVRVTAQTWVCGGMVYTLVLETSAARIGGSNPLRPTMIKIQRKEKLDYKLPIACSCGDRDLDHLIEKAQEILNYPDPQYWLTRVTHFINDFNCTIELLSDQWCGVDITCIQDYIDLHPEMTDEELDEADARGEPDYIETYKFRVECDIVEHGLASAVIHLHEMHLAFNPDGWYTRWWNKNHES